VAEDEVVSKEALEDEENVELEARGYPISFSIMEKPNTSRAIRKNPCALHLLP